MQDERNQVLILDSLLESPKTTGELAKGRGYSNPDGTPCYKIIGRDLERLTENGLIEGKKVKLRKTGAYPMLYSIVFSIPNFKNMFEKYKYLRPKMQKNAVVLETIFTEYSDLIYN